MSESSNATAGDVLTGSAADLIETFDPVGISDVIWGE